MKLAQGEHIVGEWQYAAVKTKKGFSKNKAEASLVLTNKRLVHDIVDKTSICRDEIQLKEITSISYFHSQKPNFWVWVKIVFGIILVPVILGIFILKKAIPQLGAGDFTLSVTTAGYENVALSIGADKPQEASATGGLIKGLLLFIPNLILGIFGIKLGKPKEVVKNMHVAHSVINEIIDTLGATVMDSKVKNVTVEEFNA